MRIYLNDLSFDGAFPDRQALQNTLMEIVRLRHRSKPVNTMLYCSRSLRNRYGCANEMLHESLAAFGRDVRVRILQWLNQNGPFLDDDRLPEEDDLFYHGSEDVTDQGLGEAVRRIRRQEASASHSVTGGSQTNFSASPLAVVHGLLGAQIGSYNVSNTFDVDGLLAIAEAAEQEAQTRGSDHPASWADMLLFCRSRHDRLIVSEHCDFVLGSSPFYPIVARRVIELVKILQRLMECMNDTGALNAEGQEILQTHFVGERALFTDEADGNKDDFESEMTFTDPLDANRKIICFWHGKINEPKFRLHFEWPVKTPSQGLKIAYIGPKISKR